MYVFTLVLGYVGLCMYSCMALRTFRYNNMCVGMFIWVDVYIYIMLVYIFNCSPTNSHMQCSPRISEEILINTCNILTE